MKRSSKILVLLLSLALIIGAVAVISASAVSSDLKYSKQADFEGVTVGLKGTASDGKNFGVNGITFQQGGRTGKVDVAEGPDGNKYAVITQTDKVGSSGPYAWFTSGSKPSINSDKTLNKTATNVDNYEYYVLELDVMSPTGKFPSGNIDLSSRAVLYNSSKDIYEQTFLNISAVTNIIRFGNDAQGKSYIYPGYNSSLKKYINPYEFTNIAIVVKNVSTEEAPVCLTTYIYVNGELWTTKENATPASTAKYYNDDPHMSIAEVKINYTTTNDSTQTLAFDNLKYGTVSRGSTALPEELITYDANNRPVGVYEFVLRTQNFSSFTEAQAFTGGSFGSGDGKYVINNSGMGNFIVNTDSEGNKYLVYDQKSGDTSKNITIGTGYGGAGTTRPGLETRPTIETGELVANASVSNYPYLVYEFDAASPTGRLSLANINLQGRYFKSTATKNSGLSTHDPTAASFGWDDNGSFITVDWENKHYFNPFEFNHFTIIFEGVTTDNYCTVGAYVYVNGEFFDKLEPTDYTKEAGPSFYKYDTPHYTYDEIRVGLLKDISETKTAAIDNVVTRVFHKDYLKNGNLPDILANGKNLEDWDCNIYDKSLAPEDFVVATIGDVEYTSLQAAVDAAEKGATINLLKSVYDPTTVTKALTIEAGENTAVFNFPDYVTKTEADGVYTFETMKPIFEYVKGGEALIGYEHQTLRDILTAADAGSTITLLDDLAITAIIAIPGKAITIDLNGYTVKAMASGSNTKWSMFALSDGTQLTVTSSKVGAKIFNEGFNGSAAKFGAGGMFNANPNAKLYINARDAEYNNTISFFTGNLIQGYDKGMEYHIDGGFYVCSGGDQQGFIDLRKAGFDSTVKNATFYGAHEGGAIAYAARNHQLDDTPTVTVDNCVFVGIAPTARVADPVVITITNSYIYADLAAVKSGTYPAHVDSCACATQNGNVILGEGVFMTGTISGNVTFADGYEFYNALTGKELTYQTQAWATDGTNYEFLDSSFDVTTKTEHLSFAKMTSNAPIDTITVTWKNADGEVIGTSEAVPGMTAGVPSDLKASTFIKNWLDYVPAEWETSLDIPSDATEYEIVAKEGGAYKLQENVSILFSPNLQSHFQYNLYVPVAAEGITINMVNLNGDRTSSYNSGAKVSINGSLYKAATGWPGMASAAGDMTAGVTFTYDGVEYTVSTKVSMVTYCSYILNNNYGEAAKDLAANIANYIYRGCKKLNNANASKLEAIVNNNSARMITPAESEIVKPDTTAISKYVKDVQIVVVAYGPKFRFNLTEEGKAAKSISLSTGLQNLTTAEQTTYGKGDAGQKAKWQALGYVETNNARMTSIDATTITITPTEGSAVSLKYTLANYYAQLSGADEATNSFLLSMYGYAKAAVNYANAK